MTELAERGDDTDFRLTTRLTRVTLWIAVALTFSAFVQLFVFSTDTEDWFAWTIAEPLSAAVLGSFYLASSFTALLSLRPREWVLARVAFPSIVVFIWGTLVVTVIHWDKFHFGEGATGAQLAAWAWLIVYVVDPVLVSVVWTLQVRLPGTDRRRGLPLNRGYRAILVGWAAVGAFMGASMLLAPDWVIDWWPWALTPLTSRAIGCWVLALAVLFVTMLYENDAERLRPAAGSLVVLATTLLVALARYWTHMSSGVGRWVVAGGAAGFALAGVPALVQAAGSGTKISGSSIGVSARGARPR